MGRCHFGPTQNIFGPAENTEVCLQKLSFWVPTLWFFGATLATFLHQPHLNPIYPSLRSPSCRSRIPYGLAFKGNFSNGGHLSQETKGWKTWASLGACPLTTCQWCTWQDLEVEAARLSHLSKEPMQKQKKPAIVLLTYWGLKSNL